MKRHKRSFGKPLQLQRETVRRLSAGQLDGVIGGILTEHATERCQNTNQPEFTCEGCTG